MRKILVAIDGSEAALRAVQFAAKQARVVPATHLHVLTVLPPLRVYGKIEVFVGEQHMHELAALETRAVLDAAKEQLTGVLDRVELEALEGDPAEIIARRATELGCESIVMGTHGRGRLGSMVLGSVAQHVVHRSTVPVTLVR